MPSREIWVPTTETKAHVQDGVVTVWDEIKMEKRAINNSVGFHDNRMKNGKVWNPEEGSEP